MYSSPESLSDITLLSDELDFSTVTVDCSIFKDLSSLDTGENYGWLDDMNEDNLTLIGGGNCDDVFQVPNFEPQRDVFYDRLDDIGKAIAREIDADKKDYSERVPDYIENVSYVRPPSDVVSILKANPAYDSSHLTEENYKTFTSPYPSEHDIHDMRRAAVLNSILEQQNFSPTIPLTDTNALSLSDSTEETTTTTVKPRKTKWKTNKFHGVVEKRANIIHWDTMETLGEDYVEFYQSSNPLVFDADLKKSEDMVLPERSEEFLETFQYSFARKNFTFEDVTLRRTLVMVWKGMVFIACSALEKLFPRTICRRVCPIIKKYMKTNFAFNKMRCRAPTEAGKLDATRDRLVVSALDAFRLGKWLVASKYKDQREVFGQFCKYLDVEFGAFWGRLQCYPYTHNEFEVRLEEGITKRATTQELEKLYSDYCYRRFGHMKEYNGTYDQEHVDGGKFAKFILSTNSSDSKRNASSSTEEQKKRKRRESKNRKHKKKSKRDKKKSKATKDADNVGFTLEGMPSIISEIDGKSELPFHFKLKWEIPKRRGSHSTKFDMVEFDVVCTVESIYTRGKVPSVIEQWIETKKADIDLSKEKKEFITKFLGRMKEEDIQLYAGVPDLVSDSTRESIKENNNGLGYSDISDITEVLPLLRPDGLTNGDSSDNEEDMETFWISMLSQFVHKEDSRISKSYRYDVNSGYDTKNNLFQIRCAKRNFGNQKLPEDPYMDDGTVIIDPLKRLGLPIYGDRKKEIMSMIHRYVLAWPEDAVFFESHERWTSIPFWALTFFVLTMNEREQRANNTANTVLHRIYYELGQWYDRLRSTFDIYYGADAHRAFIRGVKMFRLTYTRLEEVVSRPILSSTLSFIGGSSNHPPNIVLEQMISRCMKQRDTFLKFFFEEILPRNGKVFDLQEALDKAMLRDDISSDVLMSMLAYGHKLYYPRSVRDGEES